MSCLAQFSGFFRTGWIALAGSIAISMGIYALDQTESAPLEEHGLSSEDYQILSAALQDLFGKENFQRLVLLDRTSIGFPPGMAAMTHFRGKAKDLLDQAPQEARHAFEERNRYSLRIDTGKIKSALQVTAISASDAQQAVAGAQWREFRERHPNSPGITLLSLPGVNAEHTRALQYVGNSCAEMCGEGILLLLVKERGEWVLLKSTVIWTS